MKKLFAATALAAVLPLAAANPKYIFLFIGDGMGAPQVALATEYAREKLTLGSLPTVGVTATRSLNRFITDSAAAGTALAAGEKTNSGMIGQSPDGRRIESYAAEAVRRGKKIGVVTSVSLDHMPTCRAAAATTTSPARWRRATSIIWRAAGCFSRKAKTAGGRTLMNSPGRTATPWPAPSKSSRR